MSVINRICAQGFFSQKLRTECQLTTTCSIAKGKFQHRLQKYCGNGGLKIGVRENVFKALGSMNSPVLCINDRIKNAYTVQTCIFEKPNTSFIITDSLLCACESLYI